MDEKNTVKRHSVRYGGIVLYRVWKTNDARFILTEEPLTDSWSNSYAYWCDESGCKYDPGDPIAVSGDLGYEGCLESLGYTVLDDR